LVVNRNHDETDARQDLGGAFALVVAEQDGRSVVAARGTFDGSTAWRLRECLDELADQGRSRIVLDVEGLTIREFTGVGVLIGTLTRLRQRGVEVLFLPGDRGPYKVLQRIGLIPSAFFHPE
jgi:anti-sigma B factor antagonist